MISHRKYRIIMHDVLMKTKRYLSNSIQHHQIILFRCKILLDHVQVFSPEKRSRRGSAGPAGSAAA